MYRQNRSRSYTDAEAQGQGAYGRLRLGPSAGRVSAPPSPTARGSFMVDARRSHCPVDPGSQPDRGDARTDGWQVIQWRKNWSRLCRPLLHLLLVIRSLPTWSIDASTSFRRIMSRCPASSLPTTYAAAGRAAKRTGASGRDRRTPLVLLPALPSWIRWLCKTRRPGTLC
jgi:hypothetical protein